MVLLPGMLAVGPALLPISLEVSLDPIASSSLHRGTVCVFRMPVTLTNLPASSYHQLPTDGRGVSSAWLNCHEHVTHTIAQRTTRIEEAPTGLRSAENPIAVTGPQLPLVG